jgi:cytochrome c biogenesis protein CcdA
VIHLTDLSLIYILSVFTAGLISFFAPCIIPLIPVYVANLTDYDVSKNFIESNRKFKIHWNLIARTLLFVLGLATTFVILGFGTGILGKFLNGKFFSIVAGILIIILGLNQIGVFNFIFLQKEKKLTMNSNKGGSFGAYLLGLGFSFRLDSMCWSDISLSIAIIIIRGEDILCCFHDDCIYYGLSNTISTLSNIYRFFNTKI